MKAGLVRAAPPGDSTRLLGVVLIVLVGGYWGYGKAFAYLGIYPVYVGELALLAALVVFIRAGKAYTSRCPSFVLYWLLLIVTIVQGVVSIAVVGQPVLEVIRNLAPVYYGLFAYLAYACARRYMRHERLQARLIGRIAPRLVPWVLTALTVSEVGSILLSERLPRFPRTDVPVLSFKPTDASMPAGVVTALWLRGYAGLIYGLWGLGLACFPVFRSRSAFLALAATVALTWRPNKRGLYLIGLLALSLGVLLATDVRVSLGYREISARQMVANVTSLVLPSVAGSIDETTVSNLSWRLGIWRDILDDSLQNERLLIGLGWGVNLANEFGFQTAGTTEGLTVLRNPHNVFMTLLGRGGWIVVTLWSLLHISWLLALWRAHRSRRGDRTFRDLARLLAVYVLASLLNGSTDVFLESPQNAIPHWIIIGLGWALIWQAWRTESPGSAATVQVPPSPGNVATAPAR